MAVTFPFPKDGEEHHLIWIPAHSGTVSYDNIIPEYYFVYPEARRIFQSRARGEDLVEGGTFDTDRESYAQDRKLWCGRRGHLQEGRYSLSFNVTNFAAYSNRHVECELHRFVPTARTGGKDPCVVYLDFAAGGGRDSQSTAVTDELTSSGGQPTCSPQQRKKRGLSGIFKRPSQPVEKPRTKRASISSHRSLQLLPGDDFFANLRYLTIEFRDVEDADGHLVEADSSVADRLLKLFDQKWREGANRSPFSLPNPRFTTWNFDDLGESAVPSHEEQPRRTTRDVSPTALSPTHAHSPGSGRARTPSDLLGVQYGQSQ
ncbi:hypothetical protein C8A03DRAFT_37092 [Achaetomium macrosporum]|uniref:Uncharacterized protein n=1 Tax=Achaetomium macrosporum TaxID=79813 RepID=A0AAN7HBG3_9PEZI|nr:hypothetical protein C8A03DRAFT_37092 [Achaetomium macrosporum]